MRAQSLIPEDDRQRSAQQCPQRMCQPMAHLRTVCLRPFAAVHHERQPADDSLDLLTPCRVCQQPRNLRCDCAGWSLNGRAASCSGSQTATPMRARPTSSASNLPGRLLPIVHAHLDRLPRFGTMPARPGPGKYQAHRRSRQRFLDRRSASSSGGRPDLQRPAYLVRVDRRRVIRRDRHG